MNSVVRKRKHYSNGELNKIIDGLLHPLSKEHPEILILDGVLHGMVEQNPTESILKFIRYNGPELAHKLKLRRHRQRR